MVKSSIKHQLLLFIIFFFQRYIIWHLYITVKFSFMCHKATFKDSLPYLNETNFKNHLLKMKKRHPFRAITQLKMTVQKLPFQQVKRWFCFGQKLKSIKNRETEIEWVWAIHNTLVFIAVVDKNKYIVAYI